MPEPLSDDDWVAVGEKLRDELRVCICGHRKWEHNRVCTNTSDSWCPCLSFSEEDDD